MAKYANNRKSMTQFRRLKRRYSYQKAVGMAINLGLISRERRKQ